LNRDESSIGLQLDVFRHDVELGLNLPDGRPRSELSDDGDVMEGAVEEPAIRAAQARIGGDGQADFKIGHELRAAKALSGNSYDSSRQTTY
jgi:hypothetical protein